MNDAIILVKYTSRSRPKGFIRGLQSIITNLHDKVNYHIVASFDTDDYSMNNPGIISILNSYKNLTYYLK